MSDSIRMEIHPEAMSCDCCVYFEALDHDQNEKGVDGPIGYMVISEKVWEAQGRPATFDLSFDNVLSIDQG